MDGVGRVFPFLMLHVDAFFQGVFLTTYRRTAPFLFCTLALPVHESRCPAKMGRDGAGMRWLVAL